MESFKLSLYPRLNVLVGANGTGKSTVLVALSKLFSWYIRRISSSQGGGNGLHIQPDEIRNGARSSRIGVEIADQTKCYTWNLFQGLPGYEVAVGHSELSGLNSWVKMIRKNYPAGLPVIMFYQVHRVVKDISLRVRARYDFQALGVYRDSLRGEADFSSFF